MVDASSPEARAHRLKRTRRLANLSRKELCDNSNINIHTLNGWETSRFGGLSKKGAGEVIKRIFAEGVQCSIEWLLYEIGPTPLVIPNFIKTTKNNLPTTNKIELGKEDEKAYKELLLFRSHYHDAIDHIITDTSMEPEFIKNDCVAGIKKYKDDINQLIGKACIIETHENQKLLRVLRPGDEKETYTLICLNATSTIKNSIVYNTRLISAAEVIWLRRKNTI